MASLLHPSYALTIGSRKWTQQAERIDVMLGAGPELDRLVALFPAAAPIETGPDDPVVLALDGGDGEETVFTGTVSSLRRGLDRTVLTAASALGRLARFRPAASFENATAGTVIRNLADEAGIETGAIAEGVTLRFYVADPSRNAAEHALRLAGWSGAMLMATAEGKLTAAVVDASSADIALRYGREIVAFEIEESAKPPAVTVAGESGAGDCASPDAIRLTNDFFGGSRPEGPGLGHLWDWEPALRTPKDAASAGAARRRSLFAAQRNGTLEAWLQPKLRPGVIVEIQDLPAGHSRGPYRIEAVRHRIGPDGASTTARLMQGGDSFDPLAALGALSGAL
jgi:hypothetical protein